MVSEGAAQVGKQRCGHPKEAAMSRSRQRRKHSEKNRRQATPRDARIMEEIKNRRYLAFVRAIVNGFAARSAR